jgi:MoaA/NifB/PqqE/SkfB family radical SAM enzyme
MMSWEVAERIVRRAPMAGVKTLVITGGEPFVHPRIWDVIELARNLDLGVNITTNGMLLRKDLDRLRRSRVSSLSISLDGLGATHDRLRGAPGACEEVLETLTVLQRETEIPLSVYFVVTRENVRELVPVHEFCLDRGLGFDFWPVNGYPHLYLDDAESGAAYVEAIERIAAQRPEVKARLAYYRYGLEYHRGRRDHLRCLGLIEQFGVNHEGKLVPCCVWDQKGLQVGSAVDEPLDALLFSRRAQDLRERIHREGCVDQCFNHSLYEFQAATALPFVVGPARKELDPQAAVRKESGQERGQAVWAEKRTRRREARA